MYFKFAIFCLLFITITSSLSFEWEKFKGDYNKRYAHAEEEAERKQIFLENLNQIKDYQRTHPDATFKIGINHLADRRIEELTSSSRSFSNIQSEEIDNPIQPKSDLPASLDWRDQKVITPVYNQGQGEKDWAVASVEVFESFRAIQTKELVQGSFHQVSNCCPNPNAIFECIRDDMKGGLCPASFYNSTSTTCDLNACQPFVRFNKIKRLTTYNETTMLEWIQDSPLFVSIDSTQASFQFYTSEIYRDDYCSKTVTDHPLQLIGYGVDSGTPYWLCKNSWGAAWGDNGYIRIERGSNMCGIASFVVQIVDDESSDAVRLFNINHLCLTFFCFVFYIFFHL